jgi:very-short-patch-repair endonuclease
MPRHSNNTKHKRPSTAILIRARQLRQEQTPAETKLWRELRNRRLAGFKFRRQHPIDRFIVDFCCLEQRPIVELDGAVHDRQIEKDQARTEALETLGYCVVRWTNDQIDRHLDAVLEELRHMLMKD